MNIIARITAAVSAVFISLFVAAPAFASTEGEKFNPADEFSTVNDPLQVGAILIVGAILLIIVLGSAQLIGNLFNKKDTSA